MFFFFFTGKFIFVDLAYICNNLAYHSEKSVHIRGFFPVWIQESTDQKKLRI